MRTKALLLTAAVSAIGASVMAEVTSVNVVGFVNLTFAADGWYAVANPLNNTNNNLNSILTGTSIPAASMVYRWSTAVQNYDGPATYDGVSQWDIDYVLNPGEGFFFGLFTDGVVAPPYKVTFIGEVPQGNLSTPLAGNWNLVASQVPQAGLVTADLGYVISPGDLAYQWNATTQMWDGAYTGLSDEQVWDIEPNLKIGEALFLFRDASLGAGSWTRNFTVK